MKKEVQVIMLPTESSLIVKVYESNAIHLLTGKEDPGDIVTNLGFPQHLYLVSDEEIKEGDYIYYTHYNPKHDSSAIIQKTRVALNNPHLWRKIIATTDNIWVGDLQTEEGSKKIMLPQIPESFIKDYVKSNGEIDKVMVETYWEQSCLNDHNRPVYYIKIIDNTVIISPIEESIFEKTKLALREYIKENPEEVRQALREMRKESDNGSFVDSIIKEGLGVEESQITAEDIIHNMTWDWGITESSAREVARFCAKTMVLKSTK